MRIQYGEVDVEIDHWKWPTEQSFIDWTVDFLQLEESQHYDIYLLGGFLEVLNGNRDATPDIDIILLGDDDHEKLAKLILHGTQLGISKYGFFADILWFDRLPIYAEQPETQEIDIRMISNQWIIDGEVRKEYLDAAQLQAGLWGMKKHYPTQKQLALLAKGYEYCRSLLISEKTL